MVCRVCLSQLEIIFEELQSDLNPSLNLVLMLHFLNLFHQSLTDFFIVNGLQIPEIRISDEGKVEFGESGLALE